MKPAPLAFERQTVDPAPAGGEVFRSGVCYHRGQGKVFYFRQGHETYPIYHQPEIQQVTAHSVRWSAPVDGPVPQFGRKDPVEPVV